MTDKELYRGFAAGERQGRAGELKIIENPSNPGRSDNLLVDENWAVYGRYMRGEIIVFDGWRGYSESADQHLSGISYWGDRFSNWSPNLEWFEGGEPVGGDPAVNGEPSAFDGPPADLSEQVLPKSLVYAEEPDPDPTPEPQPIVSF